MSIDLKYFGDKLQKLRSQLEITVSEVALKTGMSSYRISQFEKGTLEPSGDDILILADYFKCDYNYFISGEKFSDFEKTDKLYRKYGSEFSKEDRWAIQEFIYLCENEHFILKSLETKFLEFNYEKKTNFEKQQGIDAANDLRNFLGYSDFNKIPTDIYSDFRKLGFHIFRRKLGNSNISGLCLLHKEAGKCILINYDEDIYRQRFSVAHEAGHAILDEDLGNEISISLKNEIRSYSEIRANYFASKFLIPEGLLENFRSHKIIWNENSLIEYSNKLKVNFQTLIYSLKNAGVIGKENEIELLKIKPKLIVKYDEEITSDLPPKIRKAKLLLLEKGLSPYYVRKCFEAYSQGIVSRGKLAEILLTNEKELPEILSLFNLRLMYEH